jgi:hypothetical protein
VGVFWAHDYLRKNLGVELSEYLEMYIYSFSDNSYYSDNFQLFPKMSEFSSLQKNGNFYQNFQLLTIYFFCNLDVCDVKLPLFVIPYNTIFRLNREAFYLIYIYIISQFQPLSIEIMKIIMFLF